MDDKGHHRLKVVFGETGFAQRHGTTGTAGCRTPPELPPPLQPLCPAFGRLQGLADIVRQTFEQPVQVVSDPLSGHGGGS